MGMVRIGTVAAKIIAAANDNRKDAGAPPMGGGTSGAPCQPGGKGANHPAIRKVSA